jgi:PAS domain S-box-containing protein
MVNNRLHPQDIIKSIGAGLCLLDKDFRILWINRQQAEWFGKPAQICGEHCYRTFEHRKHICRGCPSLKVFKTGKVHRAKRIGFTADGKKHYYQLTVSPIKDSHNRVEFALELVQDISEQVLSERRTLMDNQKLKRLYQHLSSVNKKLFHNVERLKYIRGHLLKIKSSLNKKYHQKLGELKSLKEELEDIFKVTHVLSATVNPKRISSLITRFSCELTNTDACILRLWDENKNLLAPEAVFGMNGRLSRRIPLIKPGEGISGKAFKLTRPLQEALRGAGFHSLLSVPIVFHQKSLGSISVFSRKMRRFSKQEVEVLSVFASQVAIALQETRHYEDIHKNYFDTVHALVLAEEARDPYMRGHTERVTKYAVSIGRILRLSPSEMETLRYAGEVHDIGKISIPDFILGKPGKLTPAERAMIELHPAKGAEMLEPLEFLKPALPAVRHHHERFDGTGYPDGLHKEKIPVLARILACADSFDAMTSNRPYRSRKLSVEEAIAEIKNNSGSQFDPQIAHSFIQLIRSQK